MAHIFKLNLLEEMAFIYLLTLQIVMSISKTGHARPRTVH